MDFLIDLNDLWGRVIPGLIIILDLYLLMEEVCPVDESELLAFFSGHTFISTIFLLCVLVAAFILGELSLYTIFRLRRWLPRPTPRDNLEALDVTTDNKVIRFYQHRFAEAALDSTSGELFGFCKDYLLQASPEAYTEARKREARINLKGGVIFPLLGLSVLSLLSNLWLVFAVALGLLVVFLDGFRRSFAVEHQFVYKAYYNWHILHERDKIKALSIPHNTGVETDAP